MPNLFAVFLTTTPSFTYLFDLLVRSIDVLLLRGPVRCNHTRVMKEGDWYSFWHEFELYLHKKRHSKTSNSRRCNRKARLQTGMITQSIDHPLFLLPINNNSSTVKKLNLFWSKWLIITKRCNMSNIKKLAVKILSRCNCWYRTSNWDLGPGLRYASKPVQNVVWALTITCNVLWYIKSLIP